MNSKDVSPGDRVRLIGTDDEWTDLTSGAKGTVDSIEALPAEISPSGVVEYQIWVLWDSGSRLALIPGSGDRLEGIEDPDDSI